MDDTDKQVALAITLHDPEGRLYDQMQQTLPFLAERFHSIVANVSPDLDKRLFTSLDAAGASIHQQERTAQTGVLHLGQVRRDVLAMALQTDAPFILYCDGDRVLHWADRYPHELAEMVVRIPEHDFTIFGRTPRAFQTHPRIQRDTEVIINHVFASVSGHTWDITAAARGLARAAAQTIVDQSGDTTLGVDASWPLLIQRTDQFTMTCIETEGLEFETADRHLDAVQAAGGLAQWMAQLDVDPQKWAFRLQLAQIEVESMLPYARES